LTKGIFGLIFITIKVIVVFVRDNHEHKNQPSLEAIKRLVFKTIIKVWRKKYV